MVYYNNSTPAQNPYVCPFEMNRLASVDAIEVEPKELPHLVINPSGSERFVINIFVRIHCLNSRQHWATMVLKMKAPFGLVAGH